MLGIGIAGLALARHAIKRAVRRAPPWRWWTMRIFMGLIAGGFSIAGPIFGAAHAGRAGHEFGIFYARRRAPGAASVSAGTLSMRGVAARRVQMA